MRKYIKKKNLSVSQTLQMFNSSQNIKSKDIEQIKIEDIKEIYNFLYEDNFPKILIQSKDLFRNTIEFNIQDILNYHFDNIYINSSSIQDTINEYRKEIENKYLNDYSLLNETYLKYKNSEEKDRKYLMNFRKHCIKTEEYAYHHCSNTKRGKFIIVEETTSKFKAKKSEIKYVICIECKYCFPSSCINMICSPCNHEYLSAILKENEDSNLVLATWEKYHCKETLIDQIMKCIKCKKELYLNLLTNKLVCKNPKCNFESKQNCILFKCYFCSKDFRSKAKPYNPLEFLIIKKAIKNAVIMKIKSSPKNLPCCKRDTKDLTFFHKKECKGVLYKGFLAGKEICVCKTCHAMNFIDKFNWICPLCGKKFHLHKIASVTPFKAKKYVINKENINNSNKKPTRIYFLPKESSPLIINDFDKNEKDKNETNDNINLLNRTKDSDNQNTFKYKYKYKDEKESEKLREKKTIKISSTRDNIREDINKGKYSDIQNTPRKKKLKRKTLYEVLEDRKKRSIDEGFTKNIPLKETIESVFIEKNIDTKKEEIKEKHQRNKFSSFKKFSDKNDNSNSEEKYKKYYGNKVNKLSKDDGKKAEKNINIIITNKNSQENAYKRNKNFINFTNSCDGLIKQRQLIKCKSYNLFNTEKENNINITEISNKNSNRNRNNNNNQTNYLYTTNSNYNIKVSLNINHNICPHIKREDNNEIKDTNISSPFLKKSMNKIKDIYLNEILKNTGINLKKANISDNDRINHNINNTSNNTSYNHKDKILNKYKNMNISKRFFLGNISPKSNNINKDSSIVSNNIKAENNQKGRKVFHSTNNIFKNSFLSSHNKESKKFLKDNYLNTEQDKNIELKKEPIKHKFKYMNPNNSLSSSNILNKDKKMNRYRLNYLNVANKEKKDNNNKDEDFQDLNNIDEFIKEEDENKTDEHKSIQNNINYINDINKNENEITINTNENLNLVKDKFKYDLMRNVIVSPDTISQITKDSIIPIFNEKDYRYIRPIGEGAYGLIYLVENIHNRKQFALKKILCKDLYEIMKHKNQFELIYSLNHKNIMEIYNLQYKYLDKTTYAIYVLMERGIKDWSIDIRKRIINKKPYKEEEIINILKQIVSGLVYLQKRNISHRDIKPQNILLFNGNIYKIADLGEAKNINNNDGHMTLRGSELYMSPSLYERHKCNKKDAFHNAFKSDVFSLGFSCLYAMGLNLKIIENIRELKNMKIIISSIHKDMPKKLYSDKLLKIIFKMIEVDENKRCDFIELEKELNLIF